MPRCFENGNVDLRVCAKFDQFLPVRSHFDTKRPVIFFHIATFPSPTFGPLFAFHCPLFFTKNNNLECCDVLKTVTVTCMCVQNLTNFCPYTLISTPNGDFGPEAFRAIHCAQLSTNGQAVSWF